MTPTYEQQQTIRAILIEGWDVRAMAALADARLAGEMPLTESQIGTVFQGLRTRANTWHHPHMMPLAGLVSLTALSEGTVDRLVETGTLRLLRDYSHPSSFPTVGSIVKGRRPAAEAGTSKELP